LRLAAIAAVYLATAKLGLSLAFATREVTAVWPPSGVALVGLVLFGWRMWPGVLVGALLANATDREPLALAAGIAVGNTLTALAGWALLVPFGFDARLERRRDVYALVGVAIATPLVSATLGVCNLAAHGVVGWSAFWRVWHVWWVGDAMGIVIFAPLGFALATRPRAIRAPAVITELGILFGGLCLVSFLTLTGRLAGSPVQLQYAVFPFVIWAAVRFSPRMSAAAVGVVAAFAVWGAVRDRGPFAVGSLDRRLVLLVLFTAVVSVMGLLLAAITCERRKALSDLHEATTVRHRAEVALRRSEEQRNQALARLVTAHEQERARIAGDLHDDTIQVMTAALLSLDAARRAGGDADALDRAYMTLAEAIERTRRMTFGLRPQLLEAQGLATAIPALARRYAHQAGFRLQLELDVGRHEDVVESLVLRTIQEALANAARHAGAAEVRIRIADDDHDRIRAEIVDDGVGFDPAAAQRRARTQHHFGIEAARERVLVAGGQFTIESAPGAGTAIAFSVPSRHRRRDRHEPPPGTQGQSQVSVRVVSARSGTPMRKTG
jgi:signal transduction histidine kinase